MQFDNPNKDPKITQFLEQMNELMDHYQLQLTPTLRYTPQGILPSLAIQAKVPEKLNLKGKEKK